VILGAFSPEKYSSIRPVERERMLGAINKIKKN